MLIPGLLLLIATSFFAVVGVYFFIFKKKDSSKFRSQMPALPKLSQKEELKLISVISSLSDGLVILDNELKPWIVNNSARTFLNITNQNPSFKNIALSFPANLTLEQKIKDSIQNNRTVTLHDVILNNRTFKIFISSIGDKNMTHMTTDGGLYSLGASLLIQDISAEKSVEKMKEEFSHVIVHELRAPAVAIKDSASILRSGGISEEDQRNMIDMIHNQAIGLLSQISYILDAGKVEQGKLTLNKTLGDIGKIVEESVELFLPEARKKKLTLMPKIGNALPQFFFDNNRINEAINNLLSNSLKYTNEFGMVKITVDVDDKFKSTKQTGNVVVSVSDNGIGMAKEKLSILFTKFGQLNNSTNKETQRTSSGLGLYITKGIIEAHGGQISVNSVKDKGTVITFSLPIVMGNQSAVKTPPKSAPIPFEKIVN